MENCRCSEMGLLDVEKRNILLKDYNFYIPGKRIYEYTCLRCLRSSRLTECEVNSMFVINISSLNYPKLLLNFEYDEVLNEFYKLDIEPDNYLVYFIMKIITELLSESEFSKITKEYKFCDIRHEIVKASLNEYNCNKIKNVKKSMLKLLKKLPQIMQENYPKINDLDDKQDFTLNNLLKYGGYSNL